MGSSGSKGSYSMTGKTTSELPTATDKPVEVHKTIDDPPSTGLYSNATNQNATSGSVNDSTSSPPSHIKMPTKFETVIAAEGELQNGDMKECEVEGGGKVLLVKDGGQFFAIGHKCTHFGAPLAKGAYSNGIVRCPWHGACFNVNSGDIEDFPGLDCLPKYQTKVENGQVKLVLGSKEELSESKRVKSMCRLNPKSNRGPVLIVGGGASAMSCAQTLRQDNFDGRILIVTQENDLPYDRTKLSKALDADVDTLLLRKPNFYEEYGVEVMKGNAVTGLDLNKKHVSLDNGVHLPYEKLVLATGGKPRTLICPGHDLQNVFYLRKPEDGKKIAEAAAGKHVVIVGSSFIGMELASILAKRCESITAVDIFEKPFQMILGERIGSGLMKLFQTNNVKFQMGSGVEELRGENGAVKSVLLKNGVSIPADLVIAGIGVVPSTDFIKNTQIQLDERGFVKVDEHMQTNVPDVYACGDIVVFPLSSFDNRIVNVQHWQMALKHGKTVGHAISGMKKPIRTVPFFWTVMFGKSLRFTGYSAGFDDLIIHGDVDELKFVAYFTKQNEVVAVATMNRDPVAAEVAECFRNNKKITKDAALENKEDVWRNLFPRAHV